MLIVADIQRSGKPLLSICLEAVCSILEHALMVSAHSLALILICSLLAWRTFER